jgi:chemotaxis protein CheD
MEEFHVGHRYFDRELQRAAARVLPGEYFVTAEDMVVTTVLGSCVAACIRDNVLGVGGMNHFMLPDGAPEVNGVIAPSARYGAHAMEMLVNHLVHLGARRGRLEAKVFGGGNVMPTMTATRVGERNAQFVTEYLRREQIPVVAQDLLGELPRKVCYFPASGRVLMRTLKTGGVESLAQDENEYRRRLAATRVEGEVELF